jgi:hypothetical protein
VDDGGDATATVSVRDTAVGGILTCGPYGPGPEFPDVCLEGAEGLGRDNEAVVRATVLGHQNDRPG